MNAWHSDDPEPFEGDISELHVVIKHTIAIEQVDPRYRIAITLQRSDRPKYWTMCCFHCRTPMVELMNTEIEAVNDTVATDDIANVGVGWRCPGKFCRYWYFVKLSGVH